MGKGNFDTIESIDVFFWEYFFFEWEGASVTRIWSDNYDDLLKLKEEFKLTQHI
jgi:hypothetical protein